MDWDWKTWIQFTVLAALAMALLLSIIGSIGMTRTIDRKIRENKDQN